MGCCASPAAAERALGLAADLLITLLSSSVFLSGLWPTDIDHAGAEGGDGLCFLLFCSFASLIASPWKQAQPLCSPCFGQIDANWGFFFALHLLWDQRERWGRGKRTSSSLELLELGLLPQGRWGQTPAWSDLCGGAMRVTRSRVEHVRCGLWTLSTPISAPPDSQRWLLATGNRRLVGEPLLLAGTWGEAFNLSRPWFLSRGWRGFEPLWSWDPLRKPHIWVNCKITVI